MTAQDYSFLYEYFVLDERLHLKFSIWFFFNRRDAESAKGLLREIPFLNSEVVAILDSQLDIWNLRFEIPLNSNV